MIITEKVCWKEYLLEFHFEMLSNTEKKTKVEDTVKLFKILSFSLELIKTAIKNEIDHTSCKMRHF